MELDLEDSTHQKVMSIFLFVTSCIISEVMEFEQFCEALKRYRITTVQLVMHSDRTMRLTREQCATLIELLKPVSVRLDSTESTRFEALLVNDSLELVDIISFSF